MIPEIPAGGNFFELKKQIVNTKSPERTKRRLKEMFQEGRLPVEVLILYGISGPLPNIQVYQEMTAEEREKLWEDRVIEKWGENWRQELNYPDLLVKKEDAIWSWLQEGF